MLRTQNKFGIVLEMHYLCVSRTFSIMRKKKTTKNTAVVKKTAKPKKKRAVKKSKKQLVARTRNGGKFTEAAFWQFIRAALRNKTRFWYPRLKCLQDARRPSQSSNKRLKWEFQCSECKVWFPQKGVEVHHTIEAGSLKSFADLPGFAERLFAETGWVCVCRECHKKIHIKEK